MPKINDEMPAPASQAAQPAGKKRTMVDRTANIMLTPGLYVNSLLELSVVTNLRGAPTTTVVYLMRHL